MLYKGNICWGEKLMNLVNCELFAKIFLIDIHRYTKNVFAYALTSLFAKYFLANSFHLYSSMDV